MRTVFAVLALVFFATPVALRAVGVHANAFENRRLAKAPSLSQGWDVFDQTTRFLTDRMPLREQAVRANTYISQHVFNTTPRSARGGGATADSGALPFVGATKDPGAATPKKAKGALQGNNVVTGKGGWLYISDEFTTACSPQAAFEQALARWSRLISIVRKSGRRAVLLVPPDKGGIYPEHLKLDRAQAECAREGKRRFWALLRGRGRRAGVHPLYDAVVRLKHRTRGLIYIRTDSHWNEIGGTVLTRAALDLVGGGVKVAPGEIVKAGTGTFPGDLTVLLGRTERETVPGRSIQRAPGAPKVGGRSAYLYDSYGGKIAHQLPPYFKELQRVPWQAGENELIKTIIRSDTVIFETVERAFNLRTLPQGEANEHFLRALEARLSAADGRSR